MALSDKAKGKQRAHDDIRDALEPAEHVRELVIRFTEAIPDLTLQLRPNEAIRDIKQRIREARTQLTNRRLRLIHSGRLLTDGTFLYEWLTSLEERQRNSAPEDSSGDSSTSPTRLHCSVGPASEGDIEDVRAQSGQLQPLRGFDRLAASGFTPEDIANIRRQFHSQQDTDYLDTEEFETEEAFDEHARALEEQWIDSFDGAGAASLSQSTHSDADFIQGVLIGFFFPLIPFFFLREPKPAVFWEDGSETDDPNTVIFSKRMQFGIVTGFLSNIAAGFWRYMFIS